VSASTVDADDVARALAAGAAQAARLVVSERARETPILTSGTLSERCGGRVVLKAENLQRTGSFKLRGALAKVAALDEGATWVVCGSAGNHAQALAYAARGRGVGCEVFMPAEAPVAKVAAVQGYGGLVTLAGDSVDDCVAAAQARAIETGAVFVHPFDDLQVIAGQATLGLELLDQVPDLAKVIVPVGGGGLISGLAGVIKLARPDVEVVGVQIEACAPFPAALSAGAPLAVNPVSTIADGIAVKRPGRLTLPLVERWVDDVVVVTEEDTAEAMVLLMERAKLVVEGAGAVGVAALTAGLTRPAASGATVVVLSGGNVDAGLLALLARRHETAVGRRLRVFTVVADRPGALAALLATIAQAGANLLAVEHVREAVDLQVRQTGIELTLETRGADHAEAILAAMAAAGYPAERV
jgi:threonine dehydratase